MTDEELIARLRDAPADGLGTENLCIAAADRIEALVKERDKYRDAFNTNCLVLRGTEERAERLEAALRVSRVHVANNAEGWSVSRGAARDDLIIVDAALKGEDHDG